LRRLDSTDVEERFQNATLDFLVFHAAFGNGIRQLRVHVINAHFRLTFKDLLTYLNHVGAPHFPANFRLADFLDTRFPRRPNNVSANALSNSDVLLYNFFTSFVIARSIAAPAFDTFAGAFADILAATRASISLF
jgi:hypothetical protein